jgi:hypothetical protein
MIVLPTAEGGLNTIRVSEKGSITGSCEAHRRAQLRGEHRLRRASVVFEESECGAVVKKYGRHAEKRGLRGVGRSFGVGNRLKSGGPRDAAMSRSSTS